MLDEPTNDLDLETLDLLQEVIADYEGTVLIVSHDRDFLDRTVTITLGLDGSGKVDIVAGGYEDWVRKRYEAVSPRPRRRPGARALRKQRLSALLDPGLRRGTEAILQGPARPRPAAGRDRAAGSGDRRDEAALHDHDLYRRDPKRFAALTERIAATGPTRGGRASLAGGGRDGGEARRLAPQLRRDPFVHPPLEDRQRHRAFLQDVVEVA